jgi:hypothetical protein
MREQPIDIPEDFGDLIKGGVAGINRQNNLPPKIYKGNPSIRNKIRGAYLRD